MNINFFFEDIKKITLSEDRNIDWIDACIKNYLKKSGDLNFIFCSDEYLLEINKEYLKHDYYTDIITFDYCEDEFISGDIYISVDRVEENAREYSVSFDKEVHRVIIHGVLHLLGLNDSTVKEKDQMRIAEDKCLKEY